MFDYRRVAMFPGPPSICLCTWTTSKAWQKATRYLMHLDAYPITMYTYIFIYL